MDQARKNAKEYFEGLGRDGFKDLLLSVGFEVKDSDDGHGKIVFKETLEKNREFVLTGVFETVIRQNKNAEVIQPFPNAC